MTGYLDRLIGRTLGLVPTLQPRPRSRFEPAAAGDAGVLESVSERDAAGGHPHRDDALSVIPPPEQAEGGARSGDGITANRALRAGSPASRAPGETRPAIARVGAADDRPAEAGPIGVASEDPGGERVNPGTVPSVPAVNLLRGVGPADAVSRLGTLGERWQRPALHDPVGAEPAGGRTPESRSSTPVGARPDEGRDIVRRAVDQPSRLRPGSVDQAAVQPSPATGMSHAVAAPAARRDAGRTAVRSLDRAASGPDHVVRGGPSDSADRSGPARPEQSAARVTAAVATAAESVDQFVPDQPGTGRPVATGRLSVPGPAAHAAAPGVDIVAAPPARSSGRAPTRSSGPTPSGRTAAGAVSAGTAAPNAVLAPADAVDGQPAVRAFPVRGEPVSALPPQVTVTIGRVVVQSPPPPPPPPPPSAPDPGPSQLSLEAYLDRRNGRR
jgi:hypothetical protein